MSFIKNMSLAKKLILFIFLLIFVLFTLFNWFTLTKEYDKSMESADEQGDNITSLYALDIQNDFVKTNETLLTLKSNFVSMHNKDMLENDAITEMVGNILRQNPNIIGMTALFENGKVTMSDSAGTELMDEQGRFIPYTYKSGENITVEPVSGYESEGEGDWYLIPKNERRPILTEPYMYSINDREVMMTTISQPILTESGEFLGVITADFTIDYLNDLIAEVKPMGGYGMLLSGAGNYVAHGLNPELNHQDARGNGRWEELINKVTAGEDLALFTEVESIDGEVLSVFKPIHIEGAKEYWTFATIIPKDNILEDFYFSLKWSVFTGVLMIVIISVFLVVLVRSSLKPLTVINLAMERMADGDLTATIPSQYETKNEIGQVAQHFNLMLSGMKKIIQSVETSSEKLTDSAEDLSSVSEEMMASSREVATAVHEIATGASQQATDTEETNRKTMSLSSQINEVKALIEQMITQSTNATDANSTGVSRVKVLKDKSNESNEVIDFVGSVINDLSSKVKEIDKVIHSINDISEQTNLLALNASIEAARAGESGKGFAVVADEVRKLAEQSRQATEHIQTTITGINKETDKAVQVMSRTQDITNAQNEAVHDTEEAFVSIAASVNDLLHSVNDISSQMNAMDDYKNSLVESIQSISAISEETAASAEEVSASTDEQLTALTRVTDSAEALSDSADHLQTLIKQFKL